MIGTVGDGKESDIALASIKTQLGKCDRKLAVCSEDPTKCEHTDDVCEVGSTLK